MPLPYAQEWHHTRFHIRSASKDDFRQQQHHCYHLLNPFLCCSPINHRGVGDWGKKMISFCSAVVVVAVVALIAHFPHLGGKVGLLPYLFHYVK